MGYNINGTNYSFDSSTNQRIKGEYVNKNVYARANEIVEYILSSAYENSNATPPFSWDDVENLYSPVCSECNSSYGFEEKGNGYICESCGEFFDDIDALDTEMEDIFQWFMVSDNLAYELMELGEPVIDDYNIWGRTCCGQSISMDYVISQICHKREILEGQKYDWSRR